MIGEEKGSVAISGRSSLKMTGLEKKEFMTHVVLMHCGDPLGKQQTITNKQK